MLTPSLKNTTQSPIEPGSSLKSRISQWCVNFSVFLFLKFRYECLKQSLTEEASYLGLSTYSRFNNGIEAGWQQHILSGKGEGWVIHRSHWPIAMMKPCRAGIGTASPVLGGSKLSECICFFFSFALTSRHSLLSSSLSYNASCPTQIIIANTEEHFEIHSIVFTKAQMS